MTVCQKVPKLDLQSQFWMSTINRIFSKKKLSKNINLGNHYSLKYFFSKLNFQTCYVGLAFARFLSIKKHYLVKTFFCKLNF